MKHFHLLALTFFFLSGCVPAVAQETFNAVYTFDSIRSKTGGRTDPTPVPKVSGLTFGSFMAVPAGGNGYGLSETPSSSGIFSYTGWPVSTSDEMDSSKIETSQYYSFRIIPSKGTVYNLEYITFTIARTSAGPRKYAVRGSHDGFADNLTISPEAEYDNARVANDNSIDLDDISNERKYQFRVMFDNSLSDNETQTWSESLEFRFYAWRAEKESAPFKLENVVVHGAVIQRDSATYIGSDTLCWPMIQSDVWQSTFTLSPDSLIFTQQLGLPRASFDAAVELCNMHDSLPLQVKEVQLQLTDSAGTDVTRQFEVKSATVEDVAAFSASVLNIRLIPRMILTERRKYTLQGTIRYTDPSDGVEKTTLLYPAEVTFQPSAVCAATYFVPEEAGMPLAVRVINESYMTVYGLSVYNDWGMAKKDTLNVDSLMPQTVFQYVTYPLSDTVAWGTYSCEPLTGTEYPDTILFEHPEFHRLIKMIRQYGNDTLPDMLVNDTPDDSLFTEQIYSSDGHIYKVSQADSLLVSVSILSARDSIAEFEVRLKAGEWCHASSRLPLSMQQRKVRGVERLSDELKLPLDNAWTAGGGKWLHLVDSLKPADGDSSLISERYRLTFTTLNLPQVITEVTDSICLGDSYQANGFDLPSFSESGDYQFADTLLAVNGADSIIQLALNVCSKPSEPSRIIGDSIVVRAGNYQYTISPVPNAAFYVWTVFPPAWQLTGSGETVSLNVPYDGKGVLSVKAVNRCGSSEASVLNLATESRKGAFVVYPDDEDGTFILETTGMEGKTTIAVSDLNGALIYKEEKELSTTDNTFRFTLSQPSGMYIISIVNKNTLASQKLQK